MNYSDLFLELSQIQCFKYIKKKIVYCSTVIRTTSISSLHVISFKKVRKESPKCITT